VHYAIIGCIHGNLEALSAVIQDIRVRKIERIVCLGDVVGFGPNPAECLDLVRESCFIMIRGDHDEAMLSGSEGFIERTAQGLDWTREQLQQGDPHIVQARMRFLEESRASFGSAGISFHHGSPRSCHEFMFPNDVRRDPRKLRAAFAATEKVCFHAHTHVPGVITQEPLAWTSASEFDHYFHYRKGSKALVNVGSVGQPRDGDVRACYLEIKKNELFWRRVEYDVQSVVSRLQGNEALAPSLAVRLQKGR
jgi:diadenosine tetraphosphatase ApaH/serine/threonine PP2A family protein phosphatase